MTEAQNIGTKLIFIKEHILLPRTDSSDVSLNDIFAAAEGAYDSKLSIPGINAAYEGTFYFDAFAPPEGFQFMHLRNFALSTSADNFTIVCKAYQLLYWDATHRYCGRCGKLLPSLHTETASSQEYSKICSACGQQIFPQIAPAIIIAVLNKGRLLLGHNVRFPEGLYSLIAGFMEPGETIEQCAQREVYEETGLSIRNIRYFGSQPWPFPHSLMIGLTGEYDYGEISPDGEEISDARWFTPDDLPKLPGKGSISRRIIDWYIEWYTQSKT